MEKNCAAKLTMEFTVDGVMDFTVTINKTNLSREGLVELQKAWTKGISTEMFALGDAKNSGK